ncbi:VOC family protein [Streptomyces sp. NPDC088768]|uniref:VOC family protein n=1 Tax=Streptomyces sp. NPDC088768 TaxID=3365894 RepID=UPI00382003F2
MAMNLHLRTRRADAPTPPSPAADELLRVTDAKTFYARMRAHGITCAVEVFDHDDGEYDPRPTAVLTLPPEDVLTLTDLVLGRLSPLPATAARLEDALLAGGVRAHITTNRDTLDIAIPHADDLAALITVLPEKSWPEHIAADDTEWVAEALGPLLGGRGGFRLAFEVTWSDGSPYAHVGGLRPDAAKAFIKVLAAAHNTP